jgi:uracil-DNA glycosylase family 4
MTKLFEDMKACTRCPLRQGCNQVVTGVGPLNASLLIVGEGPGEDEDLEGEPFVGRSGALLNKLLAGAGIERTSIYISNAVKCRPPGNRKPSQLELNTCKIWLWQEIKLLTNLKVIATLGSTPTALLLKLKSVTMNQVIGKTYSLPYSTAQLMPWYHPSYLLRRNKPAEGVAGAKLIEQTAQWLKTVREKL